MNYRIAIDPGVSGGIAWIDYRGIVQAQNMPLGMTAQVDRLKELATMYGPVSAILENVGGYVPGNAGPGAVKFARHVGNLEAALYAYDMPVLTVAPSTWMKSLGFSVSNYLPAGYKDMPAGKAKKAVRAKAQRIHKNAIKEAMARRYPHLEVTLNTADALGILTWAMDKMEVE